MGNTVLLIEIEMVACGDMWKCTWAQRTEPKWRRYGELMEGELTPL